MSLNDPLPLSAALDEQIGKSVTSIVFVQDYMQVVINEAMLTLYAMPRASVGGRVLLPHDAGYYDVLCSLIGKTISRSLVSDDVISFAFDNETTLSIDLKDPELKGPEVLAYTDGRGNTWID